MKTLVVDLLDHLGPAELRLTRREDGGARYLELYCGPKAVIHVDMGPDFACLGLQERAARLHDARMDIAEMVIAIVGGALYSGQADALVKTFEDRLPQELDKAIEEERKEADSGQFVTRCQ